MKHVTFCFLLISTFLFSGCASLMHPEADTFYHQAKGTSWKETALNLLTMMDQSTNQAKTEIGKSPGIHDLHNQIHALEKTFCDLTDNQRATTGYEHVVTLHKELKTVFHRLHDFQNDTSLRSVHLEILTARLKELRTALGSVPS